MATSTLATKPFSEVINYKATRQTLRGPGGIRVILDVEQIHIDDPGQGTPVIVGSGKHFGTFSCVADTAEVDGVRITAAQLAWLNKIESAVDEWLTGWTQYLRNETHSTTG